MVWSSLQIHPGHYRKTMYFVLQGTYWTIHITPEPEFSYVSFETNLSQTSYDDLVRKVVDVFKPGKFVTTLFVNQVRSLSKWFRCCLWMFGSFSEKCFYNGLYMASLCLAFSPLTIFLFFTVELQMSQCLFFRPET